MTLLFAPVPVKVSVPSFAIPAVIARLAAFVDKLLFVKIFNLFCVIEPVFVTSPAIFKIPFSPVIVLVFSPPVNVSVPKFSIPSVVVIIPALVDCGCYYTGIS